MLLMHQHQTLTVQVQKHLAAVLLLLLLGACSAPYHATAAAAVPAPAAAATATTRAISDPQRIPPTTCTLSVKGPPSSSISLACSGPLLTISAHKSITSALRKVAQGVQWDPAGCGNLGCLVSICGSSAAVFQRSQVTDIHNQDLTAALCIGDSSTVVFQGGHFSNITTAQGALLVLGLSKVTLEGTAVVNNTGNNTVGGLAMGGGLVVQEDAQVRIHSSNFSGNRAVGALAALGAGVAVQDRGRVSISNSLFTRHSVEAGGIVGFAGGAAVYAEGDAAIEARGVKFLQNVASGSIATAAGAICVMHNVTLRLESCAFTNNSARSDHAFGGALAAMNSTVVSITNTTFAYNTARGAAGLASGAGLLVGNNARVLMSGGSMIGNLVSGSLVGAGGGACAFDNATLRLQSVLVSGNKAVSASSRLGALGGGLACLNTSRCWLEDSSLADNHANCSTAPAAGGGLGAYDKASVRISRCNVTRNWVKDAQYASGGGVLAASTGSHMLIEDSTFDGSSAVVYELAGGYAGGGAVGVNGSMTVVLRHTRFIRNMVAGISATAGGAVHVNGSVHVSIESCRFIGNRLAGLPGWNVPNLISCGGALAVQSTSVMTVNASRFESNDVDGMRTCGGAACALWAGDLRVYGSQFVSNHVSGVSLSCGGAVCATDNGTMHVDAGVFERNLATGVSTGGGTCMTFSSSGTVTRSTFRHNTADLAGGAVGVSDGCKAVISQCAFANNTATNAETGCGGAVSVGFEALKQVPATCTITGSTFSSNSASGRRGSGGAIYANDAVLAVKDSSFVQNAAQQGGALGGSGVSWDLANSSFTNHTVAGPGGAICMAGSLHATLTSCSISRNRCASTAGGWQQYAACVRSSVWAESGSSVVLQY